MEELSLEKRGLFRGNTENPCIMCGKDTDIYDMDFQCPVHKECQHYLLTEYEIASKYGDNSPEFAYYQDVVVQDALGC